MRRVAIALSLKRLGYTDLDFQNIWHAFTGLKEMSKIVIRAWVILGLITSTLRA